MGGRSKGRAGTDVYAEGRTVPRLQAADGDSSTEQNNSGYGRSKLKATAQSNTNSELCSWQHNGLVGFTETVQRAEYWFGWFY